jgi:nucleoside-diphosphate-sugar epimerase
MVVGNGMLAKAFSSYINNKNVIIYESGVSNSSENSPENFQREIDLLESCIKQNADSLIIYFSTCSVNDDSLKNTKYVQHKKLLEKHIQKKAQKFIIFRLPIVIGYTKNNFTLFNFLKEKLSSNQEVFIQKNAYRYLVDIEDISSVLSEIIDSENFLNSIVDISFSQSISVLEMANIMKKELQSNSIVNTIEGGGSYDINDLKLHNFISSKKINFPERYNEDVLRKYLKKTIEV